MSRETSTPHWAPCNHGESFSQPLSLALGMTDLAHCLVKQARVHYGVHSGRIHMEVLLRCMVM